jgi:hypothetical protein
LPPACAEASQPRASGVSLEVEEGGSAAHEYDEVDAESTRRAKASE